VTALNQPSNTETIARNSFWFAMEFAAGALVTLFVSVAIARALGPEKLAYFVYISWLCNVGMQVGTLGIPAAARKYMAEHLGRGHTGLARATYLLALRKQALHAVAITAGAVLLVLLAADPRYRLPALLVALSILPAMLNSVPTMANLAKEDHWANIPGSLAGLLVYAFGGAGTLLYGWGLTGAAASFLAMRTTECILRWRTAHHWLRTLPCVPLPPGDRKRFGVFAGQSLGLLLLNLIVWDRSEVLFLKYFCSDVRQLAFYSIAFSWCRSLEAPVTILTRAADVTIMAQFGRDPGRLPGILALSFHYTGLLALPAYFALAALSNVLVPTLYGLAYEPAAPVLALAAILWIPRVFSAPLGALLAAAENQAFLLRWGILSAAVNLGLNLACIPPWGATGAALANGMAQTFLVVGWFLRSSRLTSLRIDWLALARQAAAAVAVAVVVLAVPRAVPQRPALLFAAFAGAATFIAALRPLRLLGANDRFRLAAATFALPAGSRLRQCLHSLDLL
jgi:O-antigen/teichoic acid export membrane protein